MAQILKNCFSLKAFISLAYACCPQDPIQVFAHAHNCGKRTPSAVIKSVSLQPFLHHGWFYKGLFVRTPEKTACATEGESVGKLTQWGWGSQRQLCMMDSPVAALLWRWCPSCLILAPKIWSILKSCCYSVHVGRSKDVSLEDCGSSYTHSNQKAHSATRCKHMQAVDSHGCLISWPQGQKSLY